MLTGIRHSCARFRRKRLSDREPGAPAGRLASRDWLRGK
jgi:hypothetical protein